MIPRDINAPPVYTVHSATYGLQSPRSNRETGLYDAPQVAPPSYNSVIKHQRTSNTPSDNQAVIDETTPDNPNKDNQNSTPIANANTIASTNSNTNINANTNTNTTAVNASNADSNTTPNENTNRNSTTNTNATQN